MAKLVQIPQETELHRSGRHSKGGVVTQIGGPREGGCETFNVSERRVHVG